MRKHLVNAWRARRVLLIANADRYGLFMESLLDEIGARPARLPPGADAGQLNRALTEGRISAIIVPELSCLSKVSDITTQLSALLRLMEEAREAGVPLVILCAEENVYRFEKKPWYAQEHHAIGGESREGLIQSVLQMTADGVSRGLMGDAVSTLIIRHLPCLGCGHPSVRDYSRWCTQLDRKEPLCVEHPGCSAAFIHPLDMCCGALLLGARFLLGDRTMTGAFNLGADTENILANRTAALCFTRENGGSRPLLEQHSAPLSPYPLPDGAKARLLCGVRCLIPGSQALSDLLALERAANQGCGDERLCILQQTRSYAERIP